MSTPAEVKARLDAEREGTPFLVFRDDVAAQHIHALRGTTTVGRRPERDVALTWDTEVCRLHAQLEPVGQRLDRRRRRALPQRDLRQRRARQRAQTAQGRGPARVRRDAGDVPGAEGRVGLDRGDNGRAHGDTHRDQRKVLVALCRPLQDSAYATPATNRDIAAEVHLSVDAVKAHLRVIFERFGLDDLPQNQKRARLAATALVNNVVRKHEF